ncbi:MAG TPA: MotA/TolQ/ExbB proton channel family protein [Myxococcota bacterium]
MDARELLQLLQDGGLTVYPLAFASVITLTILFERMWRYRGLERQTRGVTRETIELLVKRNVNGARSLCEKSEAPISKIFLEAMRWKNIAIEDLDRVLLTARQEAVTDLKRGLWVIGTIGSLAPYVGLFGTVVGIIRAFQSMAIEGVGGFEVVAAGISEALVATAAGLFVAIVALMFFNYLQTRANALGTTYARSCERFLQALIFVETAASGGSNQAEVQSGSFVPA